MLTAGDELGHTQLGNNNAYCQDNELTWLHWELNPEQKEFFAFVRQLIKLRREQPIFRRRKFFRGRPIHGTEAKDIYWLTPSGNEMTDSDWTAEATQCLGMGLVGDQIEETDERGEHIASDSFLILMNAHDAAVPFRVGARARNLKWERVFETALACQAAATFDHASEYPLQGHSLVLLRAVATKPG